MRRRSLVALALGTAIALSSVAPQLASSAPGQDPRAERERVRAERAKVASQIDTKKASLAEIDAALQTLDQNVRTQEAALRRTEGEVAQAKQDIADAEAAKALLSKEVGTLRDEMRRRAVRAYVNPPGDDVLSVLETKDFTTASNRKFFIELRAADDADVADRLDGARADLEYQRRKAAAAKKRADRKEAEQTKRTDAVRQARADQKRLSDNVQSSIDSQIARSIELAKTDRKLSAQIAEQQAALQARLLAQQAAQAAQAKASAAAQAAQQITNTQSPGGGENTPLPPVGSGGPGPSAGGISLCTVGGITVNCQIKDQLAGLLNDARSSGLVLTGGGYRNPQQQIELRRQHCGSSYYAIYQMPSSSCHPPTAKPGTSQHEIGLAIDFSNCSSRSSACFQWLSGHAASHGFYNLPSEPWHWSTSGR
ncbi:MAG: mannose-binding lectin [Acidimicrobiales bacterium]|nr:mannose-binding lectin [Acidimicrobiales bacterium]